MISHSDRRHVRCRASRRSRSWSIAGPPPDPARLLEIERICPEVVRERIEQPRVSLERLYHVEGPDIWLPEVLRKKRRSKQGPEDQASDRDTHAFGSCVDCVSVVAGWVDGLSGLGVCSMMSTGWTAATALWIAAYNS